MKSYEVQFNEGRATMRAIQYTHPEDVKEFGEYEAIVKKMMAKKVSVMA